MKINNVEIENIDIFDVEVCEKYEEALKKVENKDYSNCKGVTEIVKAQCEAVFEFLDTLFGEGTHKKVFGNKTNLKICFAAFDEVIQNVNEQSKELEKITNKYSPKRARRK